MNHLSQLSPAETLLLRLGSQASRKDLLKATLMDLVFRDKLKIVKEKDETGREIPYLMRGSHFDFQVTKEHERIFLQPFAADPTLRILFKSMVKIGFQSSKSDRSYRLMVMHSPLLASYIKQGFFDVLLGRFKLTPIGEQVRKEVETALQSEGKRLKQVFHTDPQRARTALLMLGGHTLLLSQMNSDWANMTDVLLEEELKLERQTFADSSTGSTDAGGWDSFDSGCGTDGGSGCGGDAGGCGGGGCGGGGCGGGCGS